MFTANPSLSHRHINLNIGADECLTELVEDNEALLEGNVKQHHVELFIDLINKYGLRPQYMRFLLVLCKCGDGAVDSNQELLAQLLLVDHPELLFTTRGLKGMPSAVDVGLSPGEVKRYTTDKGGEVLEEALLQKVGKPAVHEG